MKYLNGVPDLNDVAHIVQRFGDPILAMPCPRGGLAVINPHVTRFLFAGGKMVDVFHIKPVYYEALDGSWRPMSEVMSYHGNATMVLKDDWDKKMTVGYLRWLMQRAAILGGSIKMPWGDVVKKLSIEREVHALQMDFASSTSYPEPDAASVACDGIVYMSNAISNNQDWATARSTSANGRGARSNAATDAAFDWTCSNISNRFRQVIRGVFNFDTSPLGSGSIVTSAVLSLYGSSTTSGYTPASETSRRTDIVSFNPASKTALASTDWDATKLGSTVFASIAFLSVSTSAYNDYTLNASGLANILVTGVSTFGTAFNADVSNTAPSWSSGGQINFTTYFADETGTTKDPKLVVGYISAGEASNSWFMH